MTDLEQLETALRGVEAEHSPDRIYDFCSGFHDAAVLGHSSHPDDNPHLPDEQPCYELYRLGAQTTERIRRALHKCKGERTV